MDGKEMKGGNVKAKVQGAMNLRLPIHFEINLLSKRDVRTAILFIVLFIASAIIYWFMISYQGISVYRALPVTAVPFFVVGAIYYVIRRRFYAMIFIIVVAILSYLIMPDSVLYIIYLLVCAEGVAQMVDIIQRFTFYKIMASIERVNIKENPSLIDRLVVFVFNIPVDIDTRNLMIDKNIIMDKLPWKDMIFSMLLALLFCMFLWIYLFLNPSFSINVTGVPIYTFTIVLYLAMIVMPCSIFSTLNARISTDYRDFKIYSGFLETFKKMFLPVFAAMIFLISAVSSGPDNLYYVAMSLGMIIIMIIFTSIMYYTSNEVEVVNDIVDKWDTFHPTSIYSQYSENDKRASLDDGVPGTPRRNPSDCFIPDFRNRDL